MTVTYYTAKTASQQLGLSERRIRQLCVDGSLKAKRVGWAWLITERDLEAYRGRR